jgi:hypothetical protein
LTYVLCSFKKLGRQKSLKRIFLHYSKEIETLDCFGESSMLYFLLTSLVTSATGIFFQFKNISNYFLYGKTKLMNEKLLFRLHDLWTSEWYILCNYKKKKCAVCPQVNFLWTFLKWKEKKLKIIYIFFFKLSIFMIPVLFRSVKFLISSDFSLINRNTHSKSYILKKHSFQVNKSFDTLSLLVLYLLLRA